MHVRLQDVRAAHAARDPELVSLLEQLIVQPEPPQPPPREGVVTFDDMIRETQQRTFRKKPLDEQAQLRMEKIAALESPQAEVPLPARLQSHQVILELWQANDAFSRYCLLELIRQVPLVYGPFKAFKRIFKEAEARDDTEIYGALAARFDAAFAQGQHGVSQRTLGYLCRRAWRYLRRVGQLLPACYPDVATDFLIHYPHDYRNYYDSWILNHIFFHQTGQYASTRFTFKPWGDQRRPDNWLKHRAFAELWKRSPRPLFTLLERAASDLIRGYAADALKSDFRAALREVEPAWVVRLIGVGSATIDEFVVWILDNVPKFEQSAFRELGLHDAVLRLFDSESRAAAKYAATYARTHARDLSVERLIQLANSHHETVNKLAVDLILSRDPRKEIGLDAWGELLETEGGHEVAAEALRKHFGARELTPEWFAERLLSSNELASEFAQARLTDLHPLKQLGADYCLDLVDRLDPENYDHHERVDYLCEQLEKFDLNALDPERLRRLLMHPLTRYHVQSWVREGKLKPQLFEADYLKRIAYHPAWDDDPWIAELKQTRWGKSLQFDQQLSETILGWLQDVRQFAPDQVGFAWLMQLVERAEPHYHKFAVETMSKSFLPADFAPAQEAPAESKPADQEIKVDLGGVSFVFTGKLATMSRSEAQGKVTAAGGANSGAVSGKLDYLVIGDEGSPLYGQGRKGSKQTKAEKLNEEGAAIRIISETAFLQMLAGEQREFSADAVQAGCEHLWSMMCDAKNPDEPLARFARTYIRRHHPDICLAETDRPVDPGAEIPPEFLTFERVKPLFMDRRKPLRDLALELAKWEFARWQPPIAGLVETCESPYPEVRDFVALALTADESPEHRRYRVDPEVLTPDAVYRFCESRDPQTRALGMTLINAHPRLRVPDELFRLTESPDGQVRAFVIRTFWSLYRDRGITADWHPKPPPEQVTKKKKAKSTQTPAEKIGPGAPPRPEQLPADLDQMHALLRRILFELPPGRPPKQAEEATEDSLKLRPLPARESKLRLVETLRDVALEDIEFARHIMPLLREFMHSRGKSEQAASLVAVTRIAHRHPEFQEPAE